MEELEKERFSLAVARIREIFLETAVQEPYRSYFHFVAGFLCKIKETLWLTQNGGLRELDLEQLKEVQEKLYGDILPGHYGDSYANPSCAVRKLAGYGQILCYLYAELRSMIPYAYEERQSDILILFELFIEIYGAFSCAASEGRLPDKEELLHILYWFESDYSEVRLGDRTREQFDPACDFAVRIIREADLSDLRYLYWFGEYISDNELRTAAYLNGAGEEKLEAMAETFTEGYRMGFIRGNKDIGEKKVVNLRYVLGFEQIVRRAVRNFERMGLRPTIYRAASHSICKNGGAKNGYYGAVPNRQYEFDHKEDAALYLDKNLMNRKLEVLRQSFEDNRELARVHGGPAVMEVFGEEPFSPEQVKEALSYSEKQEKLAALYAMRAGAIINEYVKGEERSFTIIAFPTPAIGGNFPEIFDEVARINTLSSERYGRMQQALIDVLDGASFVEVKGRNGNRTDLRVALGDLKDPQSQTNFENCVADVNIPVGEVFTTPRLKGTAGLLHVRRVYLEGLKYLDLELHFEDGMVVDYGCQNFGFPEEGRKYIRDNVLHHHETLPMGEFAIGTNTTAYMAAKRFQIGDKLPILIAEKMGPHFAVGDTCYSYAEDVECRNPDGKRIVAKDNERSIFRRTEPEKAYFNCHTDITVPYEELGELSAVRPDGTKVVLIENGRFAMPECGELNQPFLVDE